MDVNNVTSLVIIKKVEFDCEKIFMLLLYK